MADLAYADVVAGMAPLPVSPLPPLTAEKEAAIRRLLEISQAIAQAHHLGRATVPFVMANIGVQRAEDSAHIERVLGEEADAVFADDLHNFITPLVQLYHQSYSLEDIEALTAFYQSPLGQRLLRVTPHLMNDTATLAKRWARGLAPVFYKRALLRLRNDGVQAQARHPHGGEGV